MLPAPPGGRLCGTYRMFAESRIPVSASVDAIMAIERAEPSESVIRSPVADGTASGCLCTGW